MDLRDGTRIFKLWSSAERHYLAVKWVCLFTPFYQLLLRLTQNNRYNSRRLETWKVTTTSQDLCHWRNFLYRGQPRWRCRPFEEGENEQHIYSRVDRTATTTVATATFVIATNCNYTYFPGIMYIRCLFTTEQHTLPKTYTPNKAACTYGKSYISNLFFILYCNWL